MTSLSSFSWSVRQGGRCDVRQAAQSQRRGGGGFGVRRRLRRHQRGPVDHDLRRRARRRSRTLRGRRRRTALHHAEAGVPDRHSFVELPLRPSRLPDRLHRSVALRRLDQRRCCQVLSPREWQLATTTGAVRKNKRQVLGIGWEIDRELEMMNTIHVVDLSASRSADETPKWLKGLTSLK